MIEESPLPKTIAERIQELHDRLIKIDGATRKYKVLRDYKGTYIEKLLQKEEQMISPIFRVFEPVKPDRKRKLNIDPADEFDYFNDSLMDYPSIIGHKLKKSWDKFNRLISVQIPLCLNNCWYCYLPRDLYAGDDRFYLLSAKEIVDKFLEQRSLDEIRGKSSNVLRITGGEPFLLPELILECLQYIEQKNLQNEVFLWTETNLLPFIGKIGEAFVDKEEYKNIIKQIGKFNNVAVHPCFHGLDKDEVNYITDQQHDITLEKHIDALKRLIELGIDIYPTFGSNVCNPKYIKSFFDALIQIDVDLPLRFALVEYNLDYEPIETRLGNGSGRLSALYSRFASLRIWNKLLLNNNSIGYGLLPRHLISLDKKRPSCALENITYENEILYFFKSSFRSLYHREVLDLLALPKDHMITVNYDKIHIQDDLFYHMKFLPGTYIGRKCIWSYVDTDQRSLLPLRECEVANVTHAGDVLSFTLILKNYISFPLFKDKANLADKYTEMMHKYFGSKTGPPGGKYLLLGEYLLSDNMRKEFKFEDVINIGDDFLDFRSIVSQIISSIRMKKSLFYRINTIEHEEKTSRNNTTLYKIAAGRSFRISIDYFLPNYKEFDEKNSEERKICFDLSSKSISCIGLKEFVCSTYGSEEIVFRAEEVKNEEEVVISLWAKNDEFKAAKTNIHILIKPRRIKNASIAWLGGSVTALIAFVLAQLGRGYSFANITDTLFNNMLIIMVLLIIFWLAFYTQGFKYN